MSAPEPGCPSWCENHEPAGILGTIRVDEVHGAHRWRGAVPVSLIQVGAGRPYLRFDITDVSLRDAGGLADTMRRLGHPEIEAAIVELAALIPF